MSPWYSKSGSMITQATEWMKFIAASGVVAAGVFSFGMKFVERFSAIPVLQQDVKVMKRQMRYVVSGMEKLTRTTYPRESHGEGELE